MLAYIKGIIEYKHTDHIVIEANGIGYKIFTSLTTIQSSNAVGNEVKVFTYLHVREDSMKLYGFLTHEELKMFELLISVTGVGPKVAISLMSVISPSKFSLAVITDDVKTLTKAPGIGNKTAQRIILELKDKIKKEQGEYAEIAGKAEISMTDRETMKAQEAITALMVLGYTPLEATKAVSTVYSEELDIETIIKNSLKELI
ncbi:MAG TPA: Holliday junction branch migration protein RuvA [Clostridiaceae bacterium]|jgi:Holliday junction DNA helicase RuvA|nr:Holliday junction branch migration protein RuvA [Clostridiaceae bacterium]